jgi:transcriptional regulator GlxA family with amidase domain
MSVALPASVLFPRPVDLPMREPELRVGFLLAPRFSLLPVASFIDALRHAATRRTLAARSTAVGRS